MSSDDDSSTVDIHPFVNPFVELNAGLWSLFAGATVFLALRLWCKVTRRHGLWYDDYILVVTWTLLLANNTLIIYEFATGYVLKDSSQQWDDRMHILINVSSCGTLIGQAWSKTAFGVTLLRMSNRWQKGILWFCIITMNIYMVVKVVFQWAKVCGSKSYDVDWRLDICLEKHFRNDFKEGGNVYNIIMDFIFASFPWLITRSLEMRRAEKVGLCITMSLGMIVAIVAAIRVSWKDEGNDRDAWYIYRNGMSQVWYSSEITGTIIVQCIPILRPILREIHTSLTSKKLESTADGRSTTFGSKMSSGKRISATIHGNGPPSAGLDKQGNERIALREIPEEPAESWNWKDPASRGSSSPSDTDYKPRPPTAPLPDMWPLSGSEGPDLSKGSHSGKSLDFDDDNNGPRSAVSHLDVDIEAAPVQGLSPPPPRRFP
ncbi:hypothetical protein CGCF415_v006601 [Colletotrichum fructicola]|uniref:Rhodopsin domain-containing protein n=5 Tax=Colletotrichum gloeosporioides species complex TaxID=2707338 RepID=A0A9W4W4J4_9PEZI|nr:uncharacterized protein CGMCC3_g12137 [Colletotrichum fructicola]XP_036499231.1 uncharacterized protein CGCS363_v003171 [Colletotrichum siamense]XP_053034806.1 uncharacterized protein COL26b_008545 [Colletotrichum chrysophilum]KAF4482897.1 hypothetical protein CGGC5_v009646 [Colletotrichum fructicola Nara gc5]KAF4836210.1 hypothetical protein CGCTS75_v002149 [Colletotrichum tropicale]KAH9227839.1 hypothetical protein K456DRAFT_41994 [Colletotrichum gloeosporioides 23]KAI8157316.1 hypotheti